MEFKIVRYDNIEKELWNKWVYQIKESTYLHSSMFLDFLHSLMSKQNIHTFACIRNNDTPIALCPLGISTVQFSNIKFVEGSWNGAPLAVPAITEMTPSARNRTQKELFEIVHDIFQRESVQRNFMKRHPINKNVLSGIIDSYQLSVMQLGYECIPQNTVIINLELQEEDLVLQLSKYQRKRIKLSIRDGLEVKVFRGSPENIDRVFLEYQLAHEKSAGKLTRPQESFNLMLDLLKNSQASMFVAYYCNIPISYLYCGEFSDFAFGWSQVNIEEYEKQYSPRQFLEWSAIINYKQRGYKFYEVGTLWHGPQLYKLPTEKELSISEFKRRFGGILLPELCFEKFYNQDLWNKVFEKRKELFNSSGYFKTNV